MKKLYEFWISDQSSGALEITDDPTARFGQLHESNAKLLYSKSFESYDEFKRFYEKFFFEGLKGRLPLINVSATKFLFHEYPCALKARDVLVLKSGFIQNLHGRTNDFMKKIGWKFSVVPGDKEFPWIIWVKAHKTDSQQIYFPIHEDNILRFKKEIELSVSCPAGSTPVLIFQSEAVNMIQRISKSLRELGADPVWKEADACERIWSWDFPCNLLKLLEEKLNNAEPLDQL